MAMRPSFVSSGGGTPGMGSRTSNRSTVSAASGTDGKPKVELSKALPAVWELLRPRRWILLGGLALMIVNRVSGLVLPATTKLLIDNVMGKHHVSLLPKLVGAVLAATAIQGVTSFTLTQLLSKAAQRLITELRMQVQQHVGLLSVSFYDANRTGVLVPAS